MINTRAAPYSAARVDLLAEGIGKACNGIAPGDNNRTLRQHARA